MDWLIDIIFGFAIGYLIAEGVKFYFARKIRQERINEVHERLLQEIEDCLKLHIREDRGQFYAYDAETEEFYAQGSTVSSMMINIRENTKKNKIIIVSSDDGAKQPVIEFLEQKLGKTPNTVGLS